MGDYGARIKVAREAANMTQEQLGREIGVTGVTIMRYEKNQREPTQGKLKKLAAALNVPVAVLIGEAPIEVPHDASDSLRVGDTFFDGRAKITKVSTAENGKLDITIDFEEGTSQEDAALFRAALEQTAELERISRETEVPMKELIQLAEAAVKAVRETTKANAAPEDGEK